MATAKTGSRRRPWLRWFRHQTLVGAEAVLLVGALQQVMSQHLASLTMPNPLRVVIIMLMVMGVIGGVFVLARLVAKVGMAHTHEVARALPIPAATWLAHAAAFLAIFVLYAIVWHLPVTLPLIGQVGSPPP